MDDDDEDFERLFFDECRDLLGNLQEHLNTLADGNADEETVHAAFRAVHSVKGGASAFGFDQLIDFAHIFETCMDLVRTDKIAPTPAAWQTLLRSADMMEVLVESAEAGTTVDAVKLLAMTNELDNLIDGWGGETNTEQPTHDGGELVNDSSNPDTVALTTDDDAPDDQTNTFLVVFQPDTDFFTAGHDMLRLIRAARPLGLSQVSVLGDTPELVTFDPYVCPIAWELTFETQQSADQLEGFFEIYNHTATIGITSRTIDDDLISPNADAVQNITPEPKEVPAPMTAPADTPIDNAATPPIQVSAGKPNNSSKSLRVELPRIDRLVNLVGEMLITQSGLAQRLLETDEATFGGHTTIADMGHSVDAMSRQLRELQESVMAIRAQPIKSVFSRMPRIVRDLADNLGKDAKLTLIGEHTEVDATVIEELSEPLTHMLRNSMDHGLEHNDERERLGKPRIGQIRLAAEHRGERVIITIEDDGAGVNRDLVRAKALQKGLIAQDDFLTPEDIDQLIFRPGFSTVEEVSSVSGRGVGMDVVKKKIMSLGGRCTLESIPGKGSRFEITLPLTLAVMDGMTIVVGGQKFILPLSSVIEALNIEASKRKTLPNRSELLERRGEYLRLIDLRRVLNLSIDDASTEMAIVVDTETNGLIALAVDELIGQRQIVLKSLEANFKRVDGISGATILGDGQVALILDVPELLTMTPEILPGQEMVH